MFQCLRIHFNTFWQFLLISARNCVRAIEAPFTCASVMSFSTQWLQFYFLEKNLSFWVQFSRTQHKAFLLRKNYQWADSNGPAEKCHKASIEASTYKQINTQRTGIKDSLQKAYGIYACISGNHWLSRHSQSHVLKNWESIEITVWL